MIVCLRVREVVVASTRWLGWGLGGPGRKRCVLVFWLVLLWDVNRVFKLWVHFIYLPLVGILRIRWSSYLSS